MSDNEHARFSPSAAHRWLACPGSLLAEEALPQTTSEFAEEGTMAHDIAEKRLKKKKHKKVTPEMDEEVAKYVDYVKAIGGQQEYEQKVDMGEWIPDCWGTLDMVGIHDEEIDGVDLKYGKGVKISAQNNPQGALYLIGVLSERSAFQKFKVVRFHIVQPRLDHISVWETTPEELYEWAKWAAGRAKLCLEPNAPRTPGEKQCRFCRAKATCPALMQHTEQTLMASFDDLDALKPAEQLSQSELSNILMQKSLIEKWLKSVEEHVKNHIEGGESFPGWKIVAGRSVRKWADEQEAEKLLQKFLGDAAYVKKLLTAPQAEKALGKENKAVLEKLIVKPEGAPTLVPEDDPRESIITTASDFD